MDTLKNQFQFLAKNDEKDNIALCLIRLLGRYLSHKSWKSAVSVLCFTIHTLQLESLRFIELLNENTVAYAFAQQALSTKLGLQSKFFDQEDLDALKECMSSLETSAVIATLLDLLKVHFDIEIAQRLLSTTANVKVKGQVARMHLKFVCDQLRLNNYNVEDDIIVKQLQSEYIDDEFARAYTQYQTSV